MLSGILIATGVVGATGLVIGLFLGADGINIKVETDEREEAGLEALPGIKCGGGGEGGGVGGRVQVAEGREEDCGRRQARG